MLTKPFKTKKSGSKQRSQLNSRLSKIKILYYDDSKQLFDLGARL